MAARKDKKRQDLARYLDLYQGFGVEDGGPSQRAIWLMLARHGTRDGATKASRALWKQLADVNEFRITAPEEIAAIIKSHVKNDPLRVAQRLREFLRRFFKDQHKLDLTVLGDKTLDQVRKYLNGLEELAPAMGLALFCALCHRELERDAEEAAAEADGGKPRRRGERELGTALDRIKYAAAVAAHGPNPSQAKQANAHRQLMKAWGYRALPADPVKKKTAKKKAAKKKAAKKTPKKAAKKKTDKKKTTTRAKARPRSSRGRAASKKSSRR